MPNNAGLLLDQDTISPSIKLHLFSVIRCGLNLDYSIPNLSAEDYYAFFSLGVQQSIQPLLYHGLKKCGAPKEVLQQFDKARMRHTYLVIQHSESLKNISSALDKYGIPYVPLKGSVIRNLYPAPELRTSSDIDVLVHEEDLDKAVQAIETWAGFMTLHRAYHDISMVNSRVHLELHFNLKESMENIDQLLIKAWDYASPTGGGSCCAFTPEFQIFHVIAHMSYHFLHGGLGIRPFLDLWLLKHKTKYDETAVRDMCAECSILTFYEECCHLSEVWLGDAEHTETTKMLESYCLSGGVFGSSKFKNVGKKKKKRGWKYIVSRAFPPADEVKAYYKDDSGKDHSLAYYYGKRFASWFSKDRRGELKNQIGEILSSDQEYLDQTKELFRRLGL